MHCYLLVICKSRRCGETVLLSHQQVDPQRVEIDYPDDWFPVTLKCPFCKKTHTYAESEVLHRATKHVIHLPSWKPVLSTRKLKITPLPE